MASPNRLDIRIGYSLGNTVAHTIPAGKLHLGYVRTKVYWHEGEIIHMVRRGVEEGFTSKENAPPTPWGARGAFPSF